VKLANAMGPGVVSMSFGADEGNWTASVDGAFTASRMTYLAATGDTRHRAAGGAGRTLRALKGIVALLLGGWLTVLGGAAWAGTAELSAFEIVHNDDGVVLNYSVEFDLPRGADEALHKGVPLYFVAEAAVLRSRWYWRDARIARAERAWRLAWQPLTRQLARRAGRPEPELVRVTRDGPAEQAGVQAGDRIVRIDGTEVGGLEALYKRLWRDGPERDVHLEIRRDGETRTLTAHAVDRMKTLRKPQGI